MSKIEQFEAQLVTPIPVTAPPRPAYHFALGKPSQTWTYTDATGQPLIHILRFDPAGGRKEILPLTLWEKKGQLTWCWKGLEGPRPIYGLDRITIRAEQPVLIAEGEKTADAAAQLFPDFVTTTSLGGANAVSKTDWSVLAGRRCIVAPDLDDPGMRYRDDVIAALRMAGARGIEIFDVAKLAQTTWLDGEKQSRAPEAVPKGYDLADAWAEGWTAERIAAALAAHPGLLRSADGDHAGEDKDGAEDDGLGGMFEVDSEGVWKIIQTFDRRTKTTSFERQWVCSPLKISGQTRDFRTQDWGRFVTFKDPDGNLKSLILPIQDFASGGLAVIKRLMSHGLNFVPTRIGKEHLMEYIVRATPAARVTHSPKPGWVEDSFALPGESYGPKQIFCDLGDETHRYLVSGNYETWRAAAALAQGNPVLLFVICAAFAGPLIGPLDLEGGGFHIVGNSGCGKTTALMMAGSVWGGGDRKLGFLRTWKGSTSGHEGLAVLANDTLLALDEIGEADPGLIGQIVYMHRNGSGKNRSDLVGRLMASVSFRCFTMSTGEKTVAKAIADNARGLKPMAGQLVRLLDLHVDAKTGMPVFKELHGFPSSRALSQHLRQTALHHYGHAARAFLERVTLDLDAALGGVKPMIEGFVDEQCPEGSSPQLARAAEQFGLVAAAGELAAALDVLPFERGEALEAARTCFAAWAARQGDTRHSREHLEAIRAVQRFVSLHGTARFELLRPGQDAGGEADRPVANRAGYRKMVSGGVQYIVLPEVWAAEVCKEQDVDHVVACLRAEGLLELGEGGRVQKKVRIPDQVRPIRAYVLKPGILSWPEVESDGDREDID